jgi:hypothetical protein
MNQDSKELKTLDQLPLRSIKLGVCIRYQVQLGALPFRYKVEVDGFKVTLAHYKGSCVANPAAIQPLSTA